MPVLDARTADFTEEGKAILRQWIADLRSGTYSQTKGKLWRRVPEGKFYDKEGFHDRQPIGFCCLGVLSVQLGERLEKEIPWLNWRWRSTDEQGYWEPDPELLGQGYNSEEGNIPDTVLIDAGLAPVVALLDTLVTMNDERGRNFDKIADFLENRFVAALQPSAAETDG